MVDLAHRDPGPMARFEEMIAEATTMSVIVQRLTDGETLKEIAKSREVPYGKLAEWIVADATRSEQYARASRIWVDALARETIDIADNAYPTKVGISHAKLKSDVRMRIASKLDRGTYGDNASVALSVSDGRALPDRETMVLETARAFALILQTGAQISDNRGKLIEHTPQPETSQDATAALTTTTAEAVASSGASPPERPAVTERGDLI